MTAGTSSGRPQSALLIPVPEAEALVGRWRMEHDPVAPAGVPAHITLVVPWLPPEEINDDELAHLATTAADEPAFDYRLVSVGWFGRRVLWLGPEPADPFRRLTAKLAEQFNTPPWDDEFDEVVPHLTVAHASDGVQLAPVAASLRRCLPQQCRAQEIWVMIGDGHRWEVRARQLLGAPPG